MAIRRTSSSALALAPAAPATTLTPAAVLPLSQTPTGREMGALIDAIFKLRSLLATLPAEPAKANAAYLASVIAAAQAPAPDASAFVAAQKALDASLADAATRLAASSQAAAALQRRLDDIEIAEPVLAAAIYDERIAALTKAIKDLQPNTTALEDMRKYLEAERKSIGATANPPKAAAVKAAAPVAVKAAKKAAPKPAAKAAPPAKTP